MIIYNATALMNCANIVVLDHPLLNFSFSFMEKIAINNFTLKSFVLELTKKISIFP